MIRLDTNRYEEPVCCSVTIGVADRVPVFDDERFAEVLVRMIGATAMDTGIAVHAYCVMPDHVHLLLGVSGALARAGSTSARSREGINPSPTEEKEIASLIRRGGLHARPSIIEFVRLVKGRSIAEARRIGIVDRSFWQRSFFDHFLRREETIEVVVRYMLENPVRAGLVRVWDAWRWSGSFVHEREALIAVMGGNEQG